MRYLSTRGEAPRLNFCDAMLAGLARDGGLYVPERLTALAPAAIRALSGLPYAEAATRLVAPFVGEDFAPDELSGLARDAYAGFRHAATAPLTQIDANLFLLELFHGPTLAFKDVAMQWLGRADEPRPRAARSARDHPRRDLGRHRRGGDRGVRRPVARRRLHPLSRTAASPTCSAGR